MSEEDKLFQPEQVDEQIESLTSARFQQMPRLSDARLISNLHHIYAEDREIIENVWDKLTAQAEQRRQMLASKQDAQDRSGPNIPLNLVKGPQLMKNAPGVKKPRNKYIRLLEISAAILVVGVLVGSMVLLLQRVRQPNAAAGGPTATPGVIQQLTPAATPMPAITPTRVQTVCNTVHPANMTPLPTTTGPAVFYMTGSGGYQSIPSHTSLIRYDLATGKRTTLVAPADNSGILDVRLSSDKQWLLFLSYTQTKDHNIMKLQLISTNGNLLQTLYQYCDTNFAMGIEWSPDRQKVAFSDATGGIKVLDLTAGNLQTFLTARPSTYYKIAFWADNQQVVLIQSNTTYAPSNKVYLLNISKGENQQASSLTQVTSLQAFCGNIALSSDSSRMFTSSCTQSNGNCQGGQVKGPSTISVLPVSGGAASIIYNDPNKAITAIHPSSASSLLIYVENTTGDLSQDGLWKINVDGSGLTRLTTTTSVQVCQYGQYAYPLTQIASNGQSYALLNQDGGKQKLIVGGLGGGTPVTINTNTGNTMDQVLLLAGLS